MLEQIRSHVLGDNDDCRDANDIRDNSSSIRQDFIFFIRVIRAIYRFFPRAAFRLLGARLNLGLRDNLGRWGVGGRGGLLLLLLLFLPLCPLRGILCFTRRRTIQLRD